MLELHQGYFHPFTSVFENQVFNLEFDHHFPSEIAKPGCYTIHTCLYISLVNVQHPFQRKFHKQEVHLLILQTNDSPDVTVEQLDKYLSSYCKRISHIYAQFRALTVTTSAMAHNL